MTTKKDTAGFDVYDTAGKLVAHEDTDDPQMAVEPYLLQNGSGDWVMAMFENDDGSIIAERGGIEYTLRRPAPQD